MQKKVSRAKRNCKWKYIRQNWQFICDIHITRIFADDYF